MSKIKYTATSHTVKADEGLVLDEGDIILEAETDLQGEHSYFTVLHQEPVEPPKPKEK